MSSDERTGKTAYANVGTGHCDMAATAGGAKLYIVGTSGTIVARAFGGDEEKQWEAGDDELKAAAASPDGKRLVVGDDDCFVKEYALPTGEFLRNVTKLTLPIAHVDASASVIAMAADGEAKIFVEKGGDPTDMMTLSGHANGVKSLAIDPKEEFLASSSCDGTMRVWALGSGKQVHCEDAACAKDGENSQALHRLAWRPDGQQLALPGARQVKVLARGSWAPAFTLSGGSAGGGGAAVGHSSEVLAVAWSANGACLASADKEKRVVVWDVASRDVMTSFTVGGVPTALAWGGAGGRALCVLDRHGKLTTFANVAPEDGVPAAAATEAPKATTAAQDSDSDDDIAGSSLARKRLRKCVHHSASGSGSDSDVFGGGGASTSGVHTEKKKKKNKKKKKKKNNKNKQYRLRPSDFELSGPFMATGLLFLRSRGSTRTVIGNTQINGVASVLKAIVDNRASGIKEDHPFTVQQLSYYKENETIDYGIELTDANLDVLKDRGCTVYFDVTRQRASECAAIASRGERKAVPAVADDRACLRASEQCYWGSCKHAKAGADIHHCCNKYFCGKHEHIQKGAQSSKCPKSFHQICKASNKREEKKQKKQEAAGAAAEK